MFRLLKNIKIIIFVILLTSCNDETSDLNLVGSELTDVQKSFVNDYIYLTYNLSPTSTGNSLSTKWQNDIRIFLDGEISTDYKSRIVSYITEVNTYLSDGTQLRLVNTLNESNVHFISGSQSSIQQVWPDMFDLIKDGNFQGYARYNWNSSNYIYKGRIWVGNTSSGLFIHELGHILGFGHKADRDCNSFRRSFMCSIATSTEFTETDKEIIRAHYSSSIPVGLNLPQMRVLIEEYVLENSILKSTY